MLARLEPVREELAHQVREVGLDLLLREVGLVRLGALVRGLLLLGALEELVKVRPGHDLAPEVGIQLEETKRNAQGNQRKRVRG